MALGLALVVVCGSTGCTRSHDRSPARTEVASAQFGAGALDKAPSSEPPVPPVLEARDTKANTVQNAPPERRIIRNATLDVVAAKPTSVRGALTDIVVSQGGFILSSDVAASGDTGSVRIVARVPAAKFEATLEAIRRSGSEVARENTTGQDVTEEFADVEARIRAEKAIEAQYLEILKKATTIADTLAVQEKLGDIRTQIERAEGRRRLLENQSDLATITINVSKLAPLVVAETGPGFLRSMKQAADDAVDISVGMVNGGIRLLGVLAPVLVFFGIPAGLLFRSIRSRRRKMATAISA